MKAIEVCAICREPVTGYRSDTAVLEMYDDGPGVPDDPHRYTSAPFRTMVPGETVETWEPCGHQRRS